MTLEDFREAKIKEDEQRLVKFLDSFEITVTKIETDPCYCTQVHFESKFSESDGDDGITSILLARIEIEYNFQLHAIYSDGVLLFYHREVLDLWRRQHE